MRAGADMAPRAGMTCIRRAFSATRLPGRLDLPEAEDPDARNGTDGLPVATAHRRRVAKAVR